MSSIIVLWTEYLSANTGIDVFSIKRLKFIVEQDSCILNKFNNKCILNKALIHFVSGNALNGGMPHYLENQLLFTN